MRNEIQVKTLGEYVHEVSKLKEIKRWVGGKKYIYRGHSNSSFELLPKIARTPDRCFESLLLFEFELVRDSLIRMPSLVDKNDSPAELLAKLQHFGLPTRLLDFSENALVALYFACSDESPANNKTDGEVIILEIESDRIWSSAATVIEMLADSTIFDKAGSMSIVDYIKFLKLHKYFPSEMNIANEHITDWMKPYFFRPIEHTERQKRQQGLFCIFPHITEENNRGVEPKTIFRKIRPLDASNVNMVKIKIRSEHKNEILADLKNFGIKKSFLFPEADKVCDDIQNNYEEYLWGKS